MATLELLVLSITFMACLSIIWSSLRAGITPVPSHRKARQTILAAADLSPLGTIIDLGSGWGHLTLALAKKYPDRTVIGYEISLIPWLTSLLLQRVQGLDNLTLLRANFLSTELPQAALLVCYLYPGGMKKLAEKLCEKPIAAMLISNTFALPGKEPTQTIRLNDLYKSPIYVYRFKQEEI